MMSTKETAAVLLTMESGFVYAYRKPSFRKLECSALRPLLRPKDEKMLVAEAHSARELPISLILATMTSI